jgi:hypothetical protein
MSCIVTGRVVVAAASGTASPLSGKKIIVVPSRDDFEFSLDSGTTWQPWEGDPNLAGTYPGGVAALTNVTGDWGFTLPWTDSTSEVRLPGGAPVPSLLWNIIDPNPVKGVRVIYGATKQAVVSMTKSTKQLITLAAPDTWQVGSVTYQAVPVGTRRYVTVPFTSASATASITMPDFGSSTWRCNFGIETDDATRTYAVVLDRASKTSTSATLRLSDIPPAGKTVWVDVEVY